MQDVYNMNACTPWSTTLHKNAKKIVLVGYTIVVRGTRYILKESSLYYWRPFV